MATAVLRGPDLPGQENTSWPRRVLIVDDQPFVRRALKDILNRAGLEGVTEAAGGGEAIVQLKSGPIDLIFCDLQMPGIDGIETLRAIAEINPDTAVVLMSGEERGIIEAAAGLAREYGLLLLGHMAKPITANMVQDILRNGANLRATRKTSPTGKPVTEAELGAGLRDGEFFALFQPKVSVATGELASVEALVRWRNPERGTVSPGEFIPAAEQTAFIDDLTFLVLEKALAAQKRWAEAGRHISVAVNLSTRSMTRLDLPDRLARMVVEAQARTGSLVMEVTESRVADNLGSLLDICARLRLKGFQLSIDDFGTGFSTLEKLGRLPFSELKVDRAFVAGAPNDPRKRAILEAALALAQKLGLRSVCEGVETEAEWDLAKALGADYVQGYFVAKPMEVEELVGWQFTRA